MSTIKLIYAIAIAAVLAMPSAAQASKGPCDTDLSRPLDAYLCSEEKLSKANKILAKEFAATKAALPNKIEPNTSLIITKERLQAAQNSWSEYVLKHCALVADLPGPAGDWHFPAANANFCRISEIEARIPHLQKWRTCATEGGGVCLP